MYYPGLLVDLQFSRKLLVSSGRCVWCVQELNAANKEEISSQRQSNGCRKTSWKPAKSSWCFRLKINDARQSMLALPKDRIARSSVRNLTDVTEAPLVQVPFPLPIDKYSQLINAADIGLMLHDSRAYYARCSSILVDLIAAGVPVIVPAGCWLGGQIARENKLHLDNLLVDSSAVRSWDSSHLRWTTRGRSGARESRFSLNGQVGNLMVRLSWSRLPQSTQFASVKLEQFAENRRPISTMEHVHGINQTQTSALFHLSPETSQVRLTVKNAYHSSPLPFSKCEVFLLEGSDKHHGHLPMGAIGLSMASLAYLPQVLHDVVQHFDHYRAACKAFSKLWREEHSPAKTVEILTTGSDSVSQPLRQVG